jgi:hypothetical protein
MSEAEAPPIVISAAELLAVAEQLAAAEAAAMYPGLAIAGALAQRGLVSPLDVAAWADVLREGYQQRATLPNTAATISRVLEGFASVLRSMATKPPGAGEHHN